MALVALLTDFGTHDAYAGVMKGVILNIAPQTQIVDLTHGVPPQDVLCGALLLEESFSFFPGNTIFVCVVDPGVGTARAAVAVQTERYTFIGPDNGLLALAVKAERARNPKCAVRVLNNPKFHLPTVSATFHGRDVFAAAAGWMARGISFNAIGDAFGELQPLDVPCPLERDGALELHVLRSDHFGNLITDLTRAEFARWNANGSECAVSVGAHRMPLKNTFAEVPAGDAVAYFGSGGRLEIAVNGGSFAAQFKAGEAVVLRKA
jgi:S-adenosyl-L-methionine hydrolase (adenosine-forming)